MKSSTNHRKKAAVVQLLLSRNVDINRVGSDTRPLCVAAGHGEVKVATVLLANKADANETACSGGCTALLLASAGGHRAMAKAVVPLDRFKERFGEVSEKVIREAMLPLIVDKDLIELDLR